MDEDWWNAFGILMCREICDGAGMGICDGAPSTCSSFNMSSAEIFPRVLSIKGSISSKIDILLSKKFLINYGVNTIIKCCI